MAFRSREVACHTALLKLSAPVLGTANGLTSNCVQTQIVPNPFPKQRLCMKKVCKTYRAANNILVEARPQCRRGGRGRERGRGRGRGRGGGGGRGRVVGVGDSDSDSDTDNDGDSVDEETIGSDLIGKTKNISIILRPGWY
jgi:hypothetical protein